MAGPCAPDDDAPSPSHGWSVVRGACCVPRETRQNRSTPTRVSRETLRTAYGCSCVSRETTSPRREVLASRVGSRRIAAEHRLGGVGTSLFTCSSSGGNALSRSASTSAGAALRAIGGPTARVSREASTPAVHSSAVLVCACTNDFEAPLSGESYDMANGSEKGGIASSAPAVTIQHSVPFHGKLTHRTLPSAADPTPRCVRCERFAGAAGWGRMEQECVPSSFGPHAHGASRSCFTGNLPVTCKNVGPHHRCREERRAARPPIPLPGGRVSRVSEERADTRGDPETPRPHMTPDRSAHPAADVQVAHSRAPPLLSTGSHAVREPSSRSATGAHRRVGSRIHRVVHIGGQRRASDLTRADPRPRRMDPTGALGDSSSCLGGEPYTSDFWGVSVHHTRHPLPSRGCATGPHPCGCGPVARRVAAGSPRRAEQSGRVSPPRRSRAPWSPPGARGPRGW